MYSIAFEMEGSFDQFADRFHSDKEVKDKFKGAVAVFRNQDRKQFWPNEVMKCEDYGLKVVDTVLCLTRKQFVDKFGMTPEQAGLKTRLLRDKDGNGFKGVVIKDPANPYTRYEAYSCWRNTHNEYRMPQANHLYQSQPDATYAYLNENMQGQKDLLTMVRNCSMTMDDVAAKVGAVRAKGPAAKAGESESDEGWGDEDPVPVARPTLLSTVRRPMQQPGVGSSSASVAGRSVRTAVRTQAAAATLAGGSAIDSGADSDDDGGNDPAATSRRKVRKLSLTATLDGQALGRQRRQLRLYAEKLQASDTLRETYRNEVNMMRNHLRGCTRPARACLGRSPCTSPWIS